MPTLAALALGACLAAGATDAPRIALVIDDLGNRPAADAAALALPGPVTYAILPFSPGARSLAEAARALDRDILLHLPMEAESHNHLLGPGALRSDMTHGEFAAAVQQALIDVPYLRGVNNHMGSVLTRDRQRMDWLMAELRAAGRLLYLDSRTTAHSVAAAAARDARLPFATRDVFLDNEAQPRAIRRQFNRLLAHAGRHGDAIGIAHPYPATLRVLRQRLAALRGIELVSLSELMRARDCRAAASGASVAAATRPHGEHDRDDSSRAE